MTVVSSKEFVTNQKKYFKLAANENIFIKRGKDTFHLTRANADDMRREDVFLKPDDDLQNALTIDDVREKLYGVIDKLFDNK